MFRYIRLGVSGRRTSEFALTFAWFDGCRVWLEILHVL